MRFSWAGLGMSASLIISLGAACFSPWNGCVTLLSCRDLHSYLSGGFNIHRHLTYYYYHVSDTPLLMSYFMHKVSRYLGRDEERIPCTSENLSILYSRPMAS